MTREELEKTVSDIACATGRRHELIRAQVEYVMSVADDDTVREIAQTIIEARSSLSTAPADHATLTEFVDELIQGENEPPS